MMFKFSFAACAKRNKMLLSLSVCLLALVASPAVGDIPEHLIHSLPGWKGALPSKQYSGYVKLDNNSGKYLHYWFVESEHDPMNDPIVLWLNGGPGCSSLDGYLNEQGPLHFDRTTADNKTLPDLLYNPYTWTKIANVIFLESPAGVGFSYSDDPSKDYSIDDNQTALDNYHFLVNFFKNYSEFSKLDFFVAGESYAGIYVPTLVNTIRVMNEQSSDKINLKGFMVGNGCVGNLVGGCGHQTGLKIHVDFYHYHALFPDALYDDIMKACGDFTKIDEACSDKINEMSQMIGKVNIYDIYTPCFSNLPSTVSKARNPIKDHLVSYLGDPSRYYGPDECIDDHVESKYMDNETVRAAIHVKSKADIGGWRICTSKIRYHANTDSLLSLYPTLIKTYRTMIFNGDVDGCVPFIGNEQWTSGLGFGIKEGWRPWMVDDQVAGYVTKYDTNGFQFVTVKGSGHMVPQFRPKPALAMFQRFLTNQPL